MKKIKGTKGIAIALMALLAMAFAPSGDKAFPELKGKTLKGKEVTLPLDLKGKYALIAIAYSIKAENDLNSWIHPVFESLVNNEFLPPHEIYFIPMTKGIKTLSSEKIEDKLRSSLDPSYHPYVILYEGEMSNYISDLGMNEKDKPYLFLVDPDGAIIYSTSGIYTEKKLEAIMDKMTE